MAKSIKMKNNVYWDSTAIMHNQKSLSDILGPHVIECRVDTSTAPAINGYRNFTGWVQNIKRGNLSVSGGQVKIGKGISLVKVTYCMGISCGSPFLYYSFPTKNGNSVSNHWCVHEAKVTYNIIYNQALIEVQENDLISFNTYGASSYTIDSGKTTMIVEAIG